MDVRHSSAYLRPSKNTVFSLECARMNLFAAYESDGEDANPSSTVPEKLEVCTEPKRRASSASNERQPTSKKSRWGQSSAFLAPVAYDRDDASSEYDDGDKYEELSPRSLRPEEACRARKLDVSRLKTLLPPPVNDTCDKHTASTSHVGMSSMISASTMSPTEKDPTAPALPAGAVGRFTHTINPAPFVGGQTSNTGSALGHRSQSASCAVPLPAGSVIKEISGADLRGHPGSSTPSHGFDRSVRAEPARSGTISKLAKRKNQLSALLTEARAAAEEHREKRASGAGVRNQTKAKYGWG